MTRDDKLLDLLRALPDPQPAEPVPMHPPGAAPKGAPTEDIPERLYVLALRLGRALADQGH